MNRLEFATSLARSAGDLAMQYFQAVADLNVESKGHQDAVSDADTAVEQHIRQMIAASYPGDAILGEEFGVQAGSTGYTWVIDPIDGTMNFVNAIPVWAVVIACVHDSDVEIGVIHDPNTNETFSARRGSGAWLNGRPLATSMESDLSKGTVAVGISNRSDPACATRMVDQLMQRGSLFHRNASGAISLAYVATGRFLGYCEPHMNAWDCIAGLLMIDEAGGRTHAFALQTMLESGEKVIAAGAGAYDEIEVLAARAFAVDDSST